VADLLWAVQNIFTLPELELFFSEHPQGVDVAAGQFNAEVGEFGRQSLSGGEVSESVERRVGELFHARISGLQQEDRRYWRGVVRELKELRGAGKLMPEGGKVSATA
jgi:hypothetical protein